MHFAGGIDKMRYEMGFIDKVAIIVDKFLEIGDALSQIFFHDAFSIAWFLQWITRRSFRQNVLNQIL